MGQVFSEHVWYHIECVYIICSVLTRFCLKLQVALASGEGPYVETVRKAQQAIDLPNVMTVDAKGLLLQPDGLHLSTNAQVQVGKMLAHAMLQSHCAS